MTRLVLLMLLFAGNVAFATDNKIKAYLTLVNEAELLVCNEKLSEAIQHYDKAFSLKPSPLGKDLLNALLCAYQLDDTGRFKLYAAKLIKNGAFSNISNLRRYLSKIPIGPNKEKYGKIWDDLSRKVIPGLDTAYRNQLIRLVQADQDVRHYFVEKQTGNYNAIGKDSLNVFDSLNVIKLKKLFATKGFPTENKVGYDHNFPGNPPLYELILRHDRAWTNRKTLDSVFYFAVINGDFPALTYGYWKDQSYGNTRDTVASYQKESYSRFGTDDLIVIDDVLYVDRFSELDKSKINRARAAINMNSLEEEAVKARFQMKHKYYRFLDGTTFLQWDGMSPEDLQKVKDKSYNDSDISYFNIISNKKCEYGLQH